MLEHNGVHPAYYCVMGYLCNTFCHMTIAVCIITSVYFQICWHHAHKVGFAYSDLFCIEQVQLSLRIYHHDNATGIRLVKEVWKAIVC